jgi:hypothetical protein
MKTVHLHLEDAKYEKLMKAKDGMNWIDFIMQLTED